jgi:hypothetical protein
MVAPSLPSDHRVFQLFEVSVVPQYAGKQAFRPCGGDNPFGWWGWRGFKRDRIIEGSNSDNQAKWTAKHVDETWDN